METSEGETRVKLTGTQYKALVATLIGAFPTEVALDQLARFHLELNIEAEIGGGGLRERVFRLIEWAQAQGRLPALLEGARVENPGNQELRELADELLRPPATSAQVGRDLVLDALREAERQGELVRLLVTAFASGDELERFQRRAAPPMEPVGAVVLESKQAPLASWSYASKSLPSKTAPTLASDGATQSAVEKLAGEYDDLRARMPSSGQRTALMESVASKLRALAASAEPDLPALMRSESAGVRLAAVMALQERPDPDHAPWLAEQVIEARPFVAYHAALALRAIARDAKGAALVALSDVLVETLEREARIPAGSERRAILEDALRTVEQRALRDAAQT